MRIAARVLITGLGLLSAVALSACGLAAQPLVYTPTPALTPTTQAQATVTVTVDPPAPPTTTVTVDPTTVTVAPSPAPPQIQGLPGQRPPLLTSAVPSPSAGSDAQIYAETADAFGVVNTYWSNLFAGWEDNNGQPVQWRSPQLYRSDGFYDSARGDDINACGHSSPMNASFCPGGFGSGTVSWDLNRFRMEAQIGDAPIYAIVAHEVSHAAQWRFRYDSEGGATPPPDSPLYEQQADCLGGATLSKAAQDGYLTVDAGDLDEIAAFIWELEPDGDHGTPAQRLHQFRRGYSTGDVETCLWNQGVPPPD